MEQSNLKKILLIIWPKIYYVINTVFYLLIAFLKSVTSYAIRQIKGE